MLFGCLRPIIAINIASTTCRSMCFSGRRLSSWFRRPDSPSRQFPSSGFKLLNHVKKLEEENWEWYTEDTFYPVRIGEIFRSRYQVLGKLGYGAHSTVWLGRDLHAHRFVALKICELNSQPARREVAAYKHISSPTIVHPGAQLLRQLLDSFTLTAPGGEHLCLVHEPLGMSLETLRYLLPTEQLSEDLLKSVLKYLLVALDCLHSKSKTIHADLQARNIHFRVEDDSIFQDFESQELDDPSPRKVDGDRVIYETRGLGLSKKTGHLILCDFGEARYGKAAYTDEIQPYVYRAPEVILDIPWSYEVDIWNVGVMIWDLFEKKHLFGARGPNGEESSEYRLAQMYAILGPPPLDYLQRSETSWEYFETDGTWKGVASIADISLETLETQLSGDNKSRFLTFVRKMLQWVPEKRHTAKQLLHDPWLMENDDWRL